MIPIAMSLLADQETEAARLAVLSAWASERSRPRRNARPCHPARFGRVRRRGEHGFAPVVGSVDACAAPAQSHRL